MVKGNIVKFTKTNGWTDGPLKPTTNEVSGTAAQVTTAVDTALAGLSNMTAGECINIIITIE